MTHQRGVSLIEALVALAVMGFGMLGIVGMQATLRQNSDVSKQRSEAVRIAQATIEARRAFWKLSTAAGTTAYGDIANQGPLAVPGITSNTTYTLTESVTTPAGGARTKTLSVDVAWTDRSGQVQSVRLSSAVTGSLPELSGALAVPALGGPTRLPRGRHVSIPPGAVDQGDGTSKFAPPGAGTVSWVFNNTSGYITQTCVASACVAFNARLLSGFVRFATDATQPTDVMSEIPPSPAFPVNVVIAEMENALSFVCYSDPTASLFVSYFCAVEPDPASGNRWSGISKLSGPVLIPSALATSIVDVTAVSYRVCRYTPVDNAGDVPAISNENHPLKYLNVTTSLINQNFLVIRAGNGTSAFNCPDDYAATPLINSNTWHHQPSS